MALNKNKVIAAAQRYTQRGQYDRAIKEYKSLVEEEPDDIRIWLKIGDLYTKKGAVSHAVQTYNRVAEHYRGKGFFLKAVAVYKSILKIDRGYIDAHLALAEMYVKLGLIPDAISQYQIVVGAYERTGRRSEGLELLKRIVDIAPDDVGNRIRLAEGLVEQGKQDDAIVQFKAVLDGLEERQRWEEFVQVAERLLYVATDQLDIVRRLANVYVTKGEPKRALARLQLLFRADPRDTETLDLLAQTFAALGQISKAVSVFRELGRIHADANKRSASRAAYRRLLDLEPDDPEALEATGHGPMVGGSMSGSLPPGPSGSLESMTEGQRIERYLEDVDLLLKYELNDHAIERIRLVFEIDPHHRAGLIKKSELFKHLNRPHDAIDSLMHLARIDETLDLAQAKTHLREVLAMQPEHDEARAHLGRLERMSAPPPSPPPPLDRAPTGKIELSLEGLDFDDGLDDGFGFDDGVAEGSAVDPDAFSDVPSHDALPDDDPFGDLLAGQGSTTGAEFGDLLGEPPPDDDAFSDLLAEPSPVTADDAFGDLLASPAPEADMPADDDAFGDLLAEPAGDYADDEFSELLAEPDAAEAPPPAPAPATDDGFGDLLADGVDYDDGASDIDFDAAFADADAVLAETDAAEASARSVDADDIELDFEAAFDAVAADEQPDVAEDVAAVSFEGAFADAVASDDGAGEDAFADLRADAPTEDGSSDGEPEYEFEEGFVYDDGAYSFEMTEGGAEFDDEPIDQTVAVDLDADVDELDDADAFADLLPTPEPEAPADDIALVPAPPEPLEADLGDIGEVDFAELVPPEPPSVPTAGGDAEALFADLIEASSADAEPLVEGPGHIDLSGFDLGDFDDQGSVELVPHDAPVDEEAMLQAALSDAEALAGLGGRGDGERPSEPAISMGALDDDSLGSALADAADMAGLSSESPIDDDALDLSTFDPMEGGSPDDDELEALRGAPENVGDLPPPMMPMPSQPPADAAPLAPEALGDWPQMPEMVERLEPSMDASEAFESIGALDEPSLDEFPDLPPTTFDELGQSEEASFDVSGVVHGELVGEHDDEIELLDDDEIELLDDDEIELLDDDDEPVAELIDDIASARSIPPATFGAVIEEDRGNPSDADLFAAFDEPETDDIDASELILDEISGEEGGEPAGFDLDTFGFDDAPAPKAFDAPEAIDADALVLPEVDEPAELDAEALVVGVSEPSVEAAELSAEDLVVDAAEPEAFDADALVLSEDEAQQLASDADDLVLDDAGEPASFDADDLVVDVFEPEAFAADALVEAEAGDVHDTSDLGLVADDFGGEFDEEPTTEALPSPARFAEALMGAAVDEPTTDAFVMGEATPTIDVNIADLDEAFALDAAGEPEPELEAPAPEPEPPRPVPAGRQKSNPLAGLVEKLARGPKPPAPPSGFGFFDIAPPAEAAESNAGSAEPLIPAVTSSVGPDVSELDFMLDSGLVGDARELLDELVAEFGEDVELANRRAQIEMLEQGHAQEADDMLGSLLDDTFDDLGSVQGAQLSDLGEDDANTHYDLGVAFKEMGQYRKAIEQLGMAARSVERRAEALRLLAMCHLEQGAPDKAVEQLEDALRTPGLRGEGRAIVEYDLATAYEGLGRVDAAIEHLEAILAGDAPGFLDVASRLARLRG